MRIMRPLSLRCTWMRPPMASPVSLRQRHQLLSMTRCCLPPLLQLLAHLSSRSCPGVISGSTLPFHSSAAQLIRVERLDVRAAHRT